VMGCFMYPADVPARLAALAASGQLDLGVMNVHAFRSTGWRMRSRRRRACGVWM
jgi:hypothetical protein